MARPKTHSERMIILERIIGLVKEQGRLCFEMACVAFETIRGSDVMDAVSEIAKGRNTRSTTGDAQRPGMGMTSIASLNKQNADFWSNRKG
ncbi:hypothetical protein DPD00_13295 [Salmonella enterica subsp. enterica serovar Bijlmer]|nr:hypothetical protein [Salmonella enterica subsp. enterica serovar Bijlmer]ECB4197831.1 DUF977 family protein [Salmonella enterica subsp. enterica serovar Bijlmer]